jgi:hypothetical protein
LSRRITWPETTEDAVAGNWTDLSPFAHRRLHPPHRPGTLGSSPRVEDLGLDRRTRPKSENVCRLQFADSGQINIVP